MDLHISNTEAQDHRISYSTETDDEKEDGDDVGDDKSQAAQRNQAEIRRSFQEFKNEFRQKEGNNEELEMIFMDNGARNDDHIDTVEVELVFDETADPVATPGTALLDLPDENRIEQGEQEFESKYDECKSLLQDLLKINEWRESSTTKKVLIVFAVTIFLGLLLFVSLFPASFVYVEYHEFAFIKNKVTNKIDYSVVYDSGCYLMAPQHELVRLKATAHFVAKKLAIMNKDGLSIKLDIMLQYFLKRHELKQLFRKYHFEYDGVVQSLIETTVKNTVVRFSLDEFRLNRSLVEASLLKELTYTLSGDCCDPCCPYDCSSRVNCRLPYCNLLGRCYPGHHVEIRYFQLGGLWIPDEIMNRLMQQVILEIETERELFIQEKAVEEKITDLKVQQINNSAAEVVQSAKAEAKVILSKAAAEKDRDVQLSYINALKKFYSQLNVTTEDNKLSLMYMHVLGQMSGQLHAYDYDKQTLFLP